MLPSYYSRREANLRLLGNSDESAKIDRVIDTIWPGGNDSGLERGGGEEPAIVPKRCLISTHCVLLAFHLIINAFFFGGRRGLCRMQRTIERQCCWAMGGIRERESEKQTERDLQT